VPLALDLLTLFFGNFTPGGDMKTFLLIAMLATYGGVMAGCQSDDNTAQHQKVHERTVTDPNGNVISHQETKTNSSDTNNNGNNP
jgi:hypothetical protein